MAEWLSLPQVAVARGLSDRPIAWCGDVLVRRSTFLDDVAAWHASFAARSGKRFALYFDDGYEFATALFGAWHAGKEVHLPGDAQPATLERLLPEVDGCAGALPGALTRGAASEARLAPLDLQATRLVVFTSGSSGEPSAIPKQLDQLDAEIHTLQAAFGERIDAAATVLATVSHQHIYGLLFVTLWSLAAGRPFVSRRFDYPEEIAAHAPGPSILVSSPAHLRRLPATLDWQPARQAVQAVFSSGGPLPPEAAESALQLIGQSPIEVFGSSETGGIAWRQRAAHGDHWRALPGVTWRLDDGLLAVQSRHLADDAWWLTADRADAAPNGTFVLLGRADRIVKIEEKRVSLTAIERALVASAEIDEARVLPLNTSGGPRLAVVAVPSAAGRALLERDGKRALNERLRAVLLQAVERVVLPRRWRYVRALPVNAQGKSTEAALTALFRPTMPEARWTTRDEHQAIALLDITAELAVFDGHFPGAPILPGVAQLDWAVRFARECFALPSRMVRIEALKFQRPVPPGTQLELALQWNAATGVLGFVYSSAAGAHANGRIVFQCDA